MRQGLSNTGPAAGTDCSLAIGDRTRYFRKATPFFVTFAVFTCAVQAAPVATLEWSRGVVLVGHNNVFVNGGEGLALEAHDRVFVTEGAEAVVEFNDGCKRHLGENTLLILQSAQCSDGVSGNERFGFHYASAIGAETPAPSGPGDDVHDAPKPPAPPNIPEPPPEKTVDGDTTSPISASNMWTAVGLTAAAGTAMYAITTSGGGSSSSSPSDPRDNLSPQ